MFRFTMKCLMLAIICFIPHDIVGQSKDFHFTLNPDNSRFSRQEKPPVL